MGSQVPGTLGRVVSDVLMSYSHCALTFCGHLSPGVGVGSAEVYIKHCAYPSLKTRVVSSYSTDLYGYWDG